MKIKLSTKSKFTLLLVAALGLLAAATGGSTVVSVNRTLLQVLNDSSWSAVHLSANHLRERQQDLVDLKLSHALQIKEVTQLYQRLITKLSQEGRGVRESLHSLVFSEGMSLWIVDNDLRPVVVMGDMPKGINPYTMTDIKGREVGENSLRLSQKNMLANALVQVRETAGIERRYYGEHFYLPDWEMMAGFWTDLEPYEKEQRDTLNNAILSMQKNFQRVRIGTSGFLFIIDGDGKLIVHPEEWDLSDALVDTGVAGRSAFVAQIKTGADKPDQADPVLLPTPGGGTRPAFLHASYFKPYDWYVGGISFVDEIRRPGRKLSLFLLSVILASTIGLVILAAALISRMTRPLAQLTSYARQLPQTDFLQEGDAQNVLHSLAVNRHGDEVEELSRAFMFMDGALRSRVRELLEATGARERMAGELQAATEIQMGILPPPVPEEMSGGRFALSASLTPAREVGGDLYDYFMLDDNRLCVAVGDVSDKGVPAALFMTMAMVLIRSSAEAASGPDDILMRVNDNLSKENPNSMFVTLFIAILDLATGALSYANAGHNPPLLRRADGSVSMLKVAQDLVAGVFEGMRYERSGVVLDPGDALFLYTDGLTEAMNGAEEQFGEAAMIDALAAMPRNNPDEILDGMTLAVDRHVMGAPASDDLTLLCLRFGPL